MADDLKVDIVVVDDERAANNVLGSTIDDVEKLKMHARVLRKLDWHLLPLVTSLQLFSFLDRTNIGNAKIAGMATDLKLVGLRYNIIGAMFSVTYCTGQVPSNIILKLVRPSRWIPTIMVAWGLVMTLTCLVKTYHQLLVARAFLGIAEAGLVPGVTYYIYLWYPRAERAKRLAIFSSATTLGGAVGGFLAYAIEKLDGIGGLHGWQWIFCLEGLATVLAALVAHFFIHDYPDTASFLTPVERHYITELLKTDSQGLATHFNVRFVIQALKDYKNYLQFGILAGFIVPAYVVSLFTPTIINELGFSASNAQLLSISPFAAACVTTVLCGIYSDKYKLRGPFIATSAFLAVVGYLVLYTQTNPGAAMVGIVLAAMGNFTPGPICLAWASSNAGGDAKRNVAIAIVLSLANTGPIYSPFIFFDPPRFHVGLGVSMGLLSCSMLLSLFMMWHYNTLNKEKERWCNGHGITEEHKEEYRDMGDDSPLFRFSL